MIGLDVVVRRVIDGLSVYENQCLWRLVPNTGAMGDRIRKITVRLDNYDIHIRRDLTHFTIHARADPARHAVLENNDRASEGVFE